MASPTPISQDLAEVGRRLGDSMLDALNAVVTRASIIEAAAALGVVGAGGGIGVRLTLTLAGVHADLMMLPSNGDVVAITSTDTPLRRDSSAPAQLPRHVRRQLQRGR